MKEKKYYLHRISHEGNVSYALMDKGYLTLGWSELSDTSILDASREPGYPNFDTIFTSRNNEKKRSRWNIWYFAQIKEGDIIVVPLYEGKFSVFEAVDVAKSIRELQFDVENFSGKWNSDNYTWKDDLLFDETAQRIVDLGFFVKVKEIVTYVPRNYVEGVFVSRMKIRDTDADITNIKDYVERGIKAGKEKKPITLYESTIEALVNELTVSIQKVPDDRKFEKLIKWYLIKCGASSFIPAKNEPGKERGADADIVAIFDNLKYVVYVQAKHHTGETSNWSVTQIKEYLDQKSGDSDYTYASWVISSAEDFSAEAKNEASDSGVRLINGKEFSRMLLDLGLFNLDEAFE